MKRREFIAGLAGAAAWPVAARGQQPKLPVIGLLSGFSAATSLVAAFHQGLMESGLVEGQSVLVEYRTADGHYDRLPELAAELINKRAAVIATLGENAAHAAKAARAVRRSDVPIVFSLGDDPVAMGLVANLNRPNDNITGVTSIGHSLGPKRVELLREFVPNANVIAFLTNPNQPRESDRKDIEDKASTFGWRLRILGAKSANDFDAVFATIVSEKIGALIVAGDTLFLSESRKLASLALHHKIPAIGALRAFTQDNGLMSYGASIPGVIRQAGAYSGRVVKGEKPADLPVMQPTKFEFLINLRTAKTLGLDVPTALLLRADEVIE